METLGERIKLSLAQINSNQTALAEAVGISRQAVSKLTSGASGTTAHLYEIATFLGVDPIWLKTGEGDSSGQQVDPSETLLIARYRRASAKLKRVILEVAALDSGEEE